MCYEIRGRPPVVWVALKTPGGKLSHPFMPLFLLSLSFFSLFFPTSFKNLLKSQRISLLSSTGCLVAVLTSHGDFRGWNPIQFCVT